ncbi:SDR family NAD(P)-dependent oxidoreductase [Nocardia brasiliensis]|uniref:SDR family NAD(P)-dependent oxidoreductase n=1 Tax=Nocardia brasiliensis TaxID=37326 RepID=UPI0037884A07
MRIDGIVDPRITLRPPPLAALDLTGKGLVVIGGTNGLGRAVARQAWMLGAEVTVVGRTFRDGPAERLNFLEADLSSLRAAVRLGNELPVEAADAVLFTQGIFAAKSREETGEGIERDMAVSHLSRIAMVPGLAPRLGRARTGNRFPARMFIMGSPGTGELGDPADLNAERDYRAVRAHQNTVAANEALVLAGRDRWPGPDYFGLNPGPTKTDLLSHRLGRDTLANRATQALIGLLRPSPETYAERIVPVLFAADLTGHSGLMINGKGRPIRRTRGMDEVRVGEFMTASENLLRRAVG